MATELMVQSGRGWDYHDGWMAYPVDLIRALNLQNSAVPRRLHGSEFCEGYPPSFS